MFIDGDDWLEPEALERCIIPADTYDVDMVIMSSLKVLHHGITWFKKKSIYSDVNRDISQPELFDQYYVNFFGINLFSVTYWGKLIRKEAFDRANLRPSDKDYSEDEIFNMYLFPHLRSMFLLDYIGYNWRWGGITSGRLSVTEQREMNLLTFVLEFYKNRMALIVHYNYDKARRPLTIELVNYLISSISSLATKKECSRTLLPFIFDYIQVIINNKEFLNDCSGEKYDVVLSGNPELVYDFCYKNNKAHIIKNTVKKILHNLIE